MSEPAAKLYGIACVTGPVIRQYWPKIYEDVARACDITLTPRDVYDALLCGKAMGWMVLDGDEIRAFLVTRVNEKEGNRWLEIMTMGGAGFKDWSVQLQQEFETYAQHMECDMLRAYCKRGVAKLLKPLGWKERQVIMEF